MSAAEELPGAEEVYGTAIAPATVTRSVFRNHWRPSIARTVPSVGKLRDHVGAMGLAACKIERGEDRRTPVLPWQRKDDWLEARLVPLLWQARFGANAQALRDALPLLASWVAGRPRYRAGLSNNDELVELLTPPFTERLVTSGSAIVARRVADQVCRSWWDEVGAGRHASTAAPGFGS